MAVYSKTYSALEETYTFLSMKDQDYNAYLTYIFLEFTALVWSPYTNHNIRGYSKKSSSLCHVRLQQIQQ